MPRDTDDFDIFDALDILDMLILIGLASCGAFYLLTLALP